MQLKQAVDSAFQRFIAAEVPSPRLNAEILMTFTLGRDRSYLFAHPERELSPEEQYRYEEVITQREQGCPTQYITGHQEFWGLDLLVSPAVLIPRPETEHVVETVLELVKEHYRENHLVSKSWMLARVPAVSRWHWPRSFRRPKFMPATFPMMHWKWPA